MEEKLFNDLLESVKQMKAIRSRKMKLEKNEITEVRLQLKVTQIQFATAFVISESTLRNWKQDHRSHLNLQ